MKRRSLAINYILVAILVMSPITVAQTATQPNRDWEAVKALPSGNYLEVRLKGEVIFYGKLISASDAGLKLYVTEDTRYSTHQDILELDKDDILKVYRFKKKGALKWGLIGAASGGAAGAAIGSSMGGCRVNQFPCIETKSGHMAILSFAGAIFGGTVGYLIGLRKNRVLVYEV